MTLYSLKTNDFFYKKFLLELTSNINNIVINNEVKEITDEEKEQMIDNKE
jgi:hypothetical protein